jgi:hypothetical protein
MRKYVRARTQREYKSLMEELELQGYCWNGGDSPTLKNYFYYHGSDTIIYLNSSKRITYGSISNIRSGDIEISFEKKKSTNIDKY